MDYVLGIDLGTSGVKAGLLDLAALKLEGVAMRGYADSSPQDPAMLWEQTVAALKETAGLLGTRDEVRAIGLSGQMHGAVLSDAEGSLLGPIINWTDRHYSPQPVIDKMRSLMGGRAYPELGTDMASGYTGAILFGIREIDPDLYRRIAHFVLPTDFLRGKLLGKSDQVTDQTNASGTGLFNAQQNRWHAELIEALGLPLDIFPEVRRSSAIAGEISAEVADRIGLQPGIPVVVGGGDNPMSMLGSGLAADDSPLLINVGTAAQVTGVISAFRRYPGLDTRSFFNGSYALMGASLAGGTSYKWLRDTIRQEQGSAIDYRDMDALALRVPAGADGLVFCGGPSRREPGRGRGFHGNMARLRSVGHRARAVMEGVLMDLHEPYETLREDNPRDFIVGAGKGMQKSPAWRQIGAGLFGKPMHVTDFENAVYGAALIAANGIGAIQNLEQAAGALTYAAESVPVAEDVRFYRNEFVDYWTSCINSETV